MWPAAADDNSGEKESLFTRERSSYCSGVSSQVNLGIIISLLSRFPDLNRVPARYEGAALPGELNRRKKIYFF